MRKHKSRIGNPLGIFIILALVASLVVCSSAVPTIELTSSSGAFTEQGAAVVIDNAVVISSSNNVVEAYILVDNPSGIEDVISVDLTGYSSLSSAFESSPKAKLVISGVGSASDYQAVLRTATIENNNQNPTSGDRLIKIRVEDDVGESDIDYRTFLLNLYNDVPEITASISYLSYSEGDSAIYLDQGLVLSDPEGESIVQIRVVISSGYDEGNDVLSFDVPNVSNFEDVVDGTDLDLDWLWDSATGELSADGATNTENYQALLRTIQFENAGVDPSDAERIISIYASDLAGGESEVVEITLDLTPTNFAPVLTVSTFESPPEWLEASSLLAGSGAISIDSAISISDEDHVPYPPDSDAEDDILMYNATVSITTMFTDGEDTLSSTSGICDTTLSCTFNSNSGQLIIDGEASIADYISVLQAVQYDNDGEALTKGIRTITFSVFDGEDNSNVGSVDILATPRNDPTLFTIDSTPVAFETLTLESALQPTFTIIDVDNSTLAYATIWISSSTCDPASDVLLVPSEDQVSAIDAAYDANTCTLSLTGVATKAEYQAVLRAATLMLTTTTSNMGRDISFLLNDGLVDSETLSSSYYIVNGLEEPFISSVTSVDTSGGTITITGTNLGVEYPVDINVENGAASQTNAVERIILGTAYCTNIVVTVENTELTCTAPSGFGSDIQVEVTVGNERSNTDDLFYYNVPTVISVTSASTSGGIVTITGTNFGPTGTSHISGFGSGGITIGGNSCINAEVTVDHTEIQCTAAVGTGANHDVVVTVSSQDSGSTGDGLYTYASPTVTTTATGSFLGW